MFIGNCYVTIRAHKTAVVEIFDLAGRLVTSSKYLPGGNNNKIALKLTNLPNGLYIFYIKMDQQVLSKKVLVVLLL